MTRREALLQGAADALFEDAPCGYLTTALDGTILRVNRTFEAWTALRREDLVEARRFQDLLSAGARIYHETHCAPLLRMQGAISEIAVDIVKADGTRLPALVNSVVHRDDAGEPQLVLTTVFDATDRRLYEQELMTAHRREHEIALELQRSLLAGDLPTADGIDIGVAYRPAVAGLEVGGDWYDAFWLENEEVIGLVVGDVVGRGLGAAATMGQLRSAVRALATTGLAPGALLEGLDVYAGRHGIGEMATLVCCHLHVSSGQLRYACAGHPPPVIIDSAEPPRYAWEGRSAPIDAHLSPSPRPEGTYTLRAGSGLLLYTDGLIERRTVDLDDCMDRLLAETASASFGSAAETARRIVQALHDPQHADDVCLLAVRIAG